MLLKLLGLVYVSLCGSTAIDLYQPHKLSEHRSQTTLKPIVLQENFDPCHTTHCFYACFDEPEQDVSPCLSSLANYAGYNLTAFKALLQEDEKEAKNRMAIFFKDYLEEIKEETTKITASSLQLAKFQRENKVYTLEYNRTIDEWHELVFLRNVKREAYNTVVEETIAPIKKQIQTVTTILEEDMPPRISLLKGKSKETIRKEELEKFRQMAKSRYFLPIHPYDEND